MMKRDRSGYRVEVYWEEFGTSAEGSMEDSHYYEIIRKPTRREMEKLAKGLKKLLSELGLIAAHKDKKDKKDE